jgi:diguanylate cyclase (GGDEF)-like protein/PAS domain S-box-containing protein
MNTDVWPPEMAGADPAFLHEVVSAAADGLLVVDHSGKIAFCNAAAGTLFGRTPADLVGTEFGYPFSNGGEWTSLEAARDGQPVFIDMRTTPVVWQERDATLATLRDVTERHCTETMVTMHLKAMDAAANGILVTDAEGTITWVNQALCKMSGYTQMELVGQNARVFVSAEHDHKRYDSIVDSLAAGDTWKGYVTCRRRDGSDYPTEQTITPIRDKVGRLTHYVAIQEDLSEKLQAEADIARLAEYDTLTDLPNRTLFLDRAQNALDRASRLGCRVAVLIMDIDKFKDINNTFGHDAGNELIKVVTARTKSLMRATDTMARLGDDEFGILLENIGDIDTAGRLVRRMLHTLSAPIDLAGRKVKVTASIGISAYPDDDLHLENLLRHAELAMYRVKSEGGGGFKYFDHAMDDEIRRRVSLEQDLRDAIKNNQLWLAYQPQMDLRTGKIVGAEALLRWTHPKRGLVSPGDFIPIAESSGLILPIGDWVISEICNQASAWFADGMPKLQFGINVSGHQFKHRSVGVQVLDQLKRSGLDIEDVDLEITETVAMERTHQVTQNVGALTDAGVSISMDDFGTGYSSLSNLQHFPVRRLKVDGSFVRGIGSDAGDEKIVEAVIGLGHSLRLSVIAEGVETESQVQFLRARDCDEIQGFLISKPLPADDFRAFIFENHPATVH